MPQPDPASDLRTLSISEAVTATGLTERTLRYLVSTRQVPIVKVGRRVRLRHDDLRAYLESNTRPARSA